MELPIRNRVVAVSALAIVLVAVLGLAWVVPAVFGPSAEEELPTVAASSGTSAITQPVAQAYTLMPPFDPTGITLSNANYFGWSLLDRETGRVVGSANAESEGNTVESMIKPWIVADYLRRESEAGEDPTTDDLDELALMIVDSNDELAEKYYQLGGADDVVDRLRTVCGLDDVFIEPTLWGMTTITPLDAVRYGACLADGRAAGPLWTQWVLSEMRDVRGAVDDQESNVVQGGRWGIIDGLPAELVPETSIKNGWTLYEDGWHVNCLAIHPEWVLSVMMRMPDALEVAAAGCQSVAEALVVERRP